MQCFFRLVLFITIFFVGSTVFAQNPLITPRLLPGNPAREWYGGPNTTLGYDILNLALARDTNTTDNVMLDWSNDGINWSSINTFFAPGLSISAPALPYNVKKFYRIRALKRSGSTYVYSDYSNVLTIVSLYPPSHLVASAASPSSVKLKWDFRGAKDIDGVLYELMPTSGYKVERSTDPEFAAGSNTQSFLVTPPYNLIQSPDNADKQLVTFVDTHSFTSAVYYYRVRAFTSLGDGEPSTPFSVAPNRLPDPLEFSAAYYDRNVGRVDITFRTHTTGQTGYRIDRSPNGTGSWTMLKQYGLTIPSDPYVDANLLAGQTYYYRVVATNFLGDSSFTVKRVDVPNNAPASTIRWYLDNAITGGKNDGTSWADAWHNFSSINWPAIKPGDTIYISGGNSGQTYTEPLYVLKGGSEGKPLSIRVGTEAGHSGKVSMAAGILLRAPWVVIDGAKDSAFSSADIEALSANQNIEVSNPNDFTCVYSSSPQGTSIRWLDIHDCGSATGKSSLADLVAGVSFSGNSGVDCRSAELAFSHIRNVWGQGVAVSGPADNYGFVAIHHNLIEQTHDDFLSGAGGLDVYNNIARNWAAPGIGHPDGFQIWAPYTRIYNNLIYDTPGQPLYIFLSVADSSHIEIYNNIIYPNAIQNHSVLAFTEANSKYISSMLLSDVLIANNLFYNHNVANLALGEQPNTVGVLQVRNVAIRNNIFLRPASSTSESGFVTFKDYGYYDFATTDIHFDNNIMSGGEVKSILVKATTYATAEDFNAANIYAGRHPTNSSQAPELVNPNGVDFRLQASDTVARAKGFNLSAYRDPSPCGPSANACPIPPDIDHDFSGADRGDVWDIGPYQYGTPQRIQRPAAPSRLKASLR